MRHCCKSIVFFLAMLIGGCAMLQPSEPIDITVASIDSLPSDGLDIRMLVKLRIQNPNDSPIDYDGIYIKLYVQDKTFASGVANEHGTIPRYGEALVAIPITISPLRVAWHALGFFMNEQKLEKIHYTLDGKLDRVGFGAVSFHAEGELNLPSSAANGSN